MPKVKVYSINKEERYRIIGDLFDIIVNLRTKKEVIDFLMGLLTSSEALMIARRLQVAKMLADEKSYDQIQAKMKVGHQTIAVVEKWLGSDDERRKTIIKKLNSTSRNTKSGEKNIKYSESTLDRYAHHRFLKEIFDW